MKHYIASLFLVSTCLTVAAQAQTSDSQMFLFVNGVQGGSQDPNHANWIDLASFHQSADVDVEAVEQVTFSNLNVLAQLDRGAQNILAKLVDGSPTTEVRVERTEPFGNAGHKPVEEWKLSDAVVSVFNREPEGMVEYEFAFQQADYCFTYRTSTGSFQSQQCTPFGPTGLPEVPPTLEDDEEQTMVGPSSEGRAFLWVDGVSGLSQDSNHRNWIDAESFEFSALRLAEEGEPLGMLAPSDFEVVVPFDGTTQTVFDKLVNGETIRQVKFELTEPFGASGQLAVEKWTLNNVRVVSFVRDSGESPEYAFAYEAAEYCVLDGNAFRCAPFDAPAQSQVELQAGDADEDYDFDQLDLVRVQQTGKYLSGQPATWGEGDWNAAPGGSVGSPPEGDGLFNQLDIVAAQQAGLYLQGSYAALDQRDDLAMGVFDSASIGRVASAQLAGGVSIIDSMDTVPNGLMQASVPEPPAIALAILACWPLIFRRHRKLGKTNLV